MDKKCCVGKRQGSILEKEGKVMEGCIESEGGGIKEEEKT